MTLTGKTVVILGGTSGIGLATARAAQAEGATVHVSGRSPERLEAARVALGADAFTHEVDASDEIATAALFERVGSLDHLFITAGQLVLDAKLAPDRATVAPALDTRFWGAVYAAKYAAPRMRSGGSITFMSGTAARRPLPGASVATASCGAVDALARALALDLAPLRVNTLQPGYVDTPLFDGIFGEQRDAILAAAGAKLPVGRIGRPEELADAVLFLMKNGYVTGINLVVDGGGVLV
ncbi:TPA: SDR family oxidoreductase [Pseudomonas aeruginosa]|nr:SDR family oxidoreductase [Pseudomonas aeruginosa]HCF9165483.1 SDR family oxidoreductase [Pseudomonas aeruginosa]HCF9179143.1 SDR family oxidoreductase [Pseudomonas aeruginosa]HCF9186395.1 SDR family oxidoreductase [Pseudomonas aeruginosa]HCF9193646.1 SDR family oxidoreductase [Pseudomonas aeruginosa]